MTHEQFEDLAALEAIGALPDEESRELHVHIQGCDSCSQALEEFRAVAAMQGLALEPVTPPREVKDKVLAAAERVDPVVDFTLERELPRQSRQRWATAAALLFALALWGWRELGMRAAKERIIEEQALTQRLSAENRLLLARNQRMQEQMQALAAPDTRTIALAGQQIAPSASARVFLEPSKRRALIFFHNMPPNPSDKSYELWIIRGDKTPPQAAGTFDVNPQTGQSSMTIHDLPVATEIKGLAVTLEPRGGGAVPTNSRYYVAGSPGL